MREWRRHHRLMAVSGVLVGLSLPFLRTSVAGLPPLPSQVLHREWLAAIDAESRRQQPSPDRVQAILSSGEILLDDLRAFEKADLVRMHARRGMLMLAGTLLSVSLVALVVLLTQVKGEAWGVGAVLAWFATAAGAAILQETVVLPGLHARRSA